MSSRNMRKLMEQMRAASLKNESVDEEAAAFEPLYAAKVAPAYDWLMVSSSSSDEEGRNNGTRPEEESSDDNAATIAVKKSKKKNNRKNRNKNRRQQDDEDEVDIDKVVAEVNDILGEPPAVSVKPTSNADCGRELLKINHKYLDLHNEVFGPRDDDDTRKRKSHNYRHKRRQIIMSNDVYNFSVRGLSMTLIETKDDIKYFKFEHGPEYQKHMHTLLKAMKLHYANYIHEHDYEVFPTNTVEALIKNLELYFRVDEVVLGGNSLEEAIAFMQSMFDPAFNYLDGKTRLEYKYVENRVFHIALLKYLHILTNKACHRTALELAKLMLNLDPSDPLGVIFIIDTLALRAREHQWLVDVYNHWIYEKDATRVFHLNYSHALAMYHLHLKNKDPDTLKNADFLIKRALVKFPNVALMIMKLTRNENEEIMNHEMFTSLVNKTTSTDLLSLQLLYAKFVFPKWREQNIMDWVIVNALEIIARFRDDRKVETKVRKAAKERKLLFRRNPLEIRRHLSVIGSMSNLLVDGAVPETEKTPPFNPFPEQGVCVDVHHYYKNWGAQYEYGEAAAADSVPTSVFRSFLTSLVPRDEE